MKTPRFFCARDAANLVILICIATTAFSQDINRDGNVSMADTARFRSLAKNIDSLQIDFNSQSDSIKRKFQSNYSKLDSVRSHLAFRLDTLRGTLPSITSLLQNKSIDSVQYRIRGNLDSLSLKLEMSSVARALDSVRNKMDSSLVDLNNKIESLKATSVRKLNAMELPPSLNSKVSEVTGIIEGYNLPISDLNLPSSDFKMPSMPTVGSISLPEVKNLDLPSGIPEVNGINGLSQGVSDKLPPIAGQAGGYANDVKALAAGNLDEVKELPQTAESKAVEMAGISEATQQQTQVLDQFKNVAENTKNPDSLKSVVVQEVRQMAVNHFAGREEQLQQAMEIVSKYKLKYNSINSLADVAKRPPNEMHGKPLLERIVPGIAMQIYKKGDDFMVDFNPYVGYRFTGRLTGGAGWNQRVAYSLDKNAFNPDNRIYGPRIFSEFKLGKGFSPRVEVEYMNTQVPPATMGAPQDPTAREWVWGAFVGIKKDYRFFKNVKGTALVMTRILNPDHKSPYAHVLNVRFGFEFPMKKKVQQHNPEN